MKVKPTFRIHPLSVLGFIALMALAACAPRRPKTKLPRRGLIQTSGQANYSTI